MNFLQSIRTLSRRQLIMVLVCVLVCIFFAVLPFFVDVDASYVGYYLFTVCIYATVAQGWNLVAGYAGQISLGQNAFFGLGAYTMALLWVHNIGLWFFFDVSLMAAACIVPGIIAVLIGIPLLARLHGDYFSFGTLGMGMIINTIFIKLRSVTGGADGLYLDASYFTSMRIYYWVALGIAIGVTLFIFVLNESRVGLALRAIREDEVAAASRGVNVLRYKVLAFALSAAIAGLAGSVYGYYLFHVQPSAMFNLDWMFNPILITVLGGTGTVLGPVIGSVVVCALIAYGDLLFGGYHLVVTGLLIILVMRFMPQGLLGAAGKLPGTWQRRKAAGVGRR